MKNAARTCATSATPKVPNEIIHQARNENQKERIAPYRPSIAPELAKLFDAAFPPYPPQNNMTSTSRHSLPRLSFSMIQKMMKITSE